MNLPNKLTLTRIILVPVFMIFVSLTSLDSIVDGNFNATFYLLAGIVFAAASFTDYLDGHLARKCVQGSSVLFLIILSEFLRSLFCFNSKFFLQICFPVKNRLYSPDCNLCHICCRFLSCKFLHCQTRFTEKVSKFAV